jgi:ribonuclease G
MVRYIGISRRIEDEEERQRLKDMASNLVDNNTGLIIRTIAAGISEEDLAADIKQLGKQWKKIQSRAAKSKAPSLIHKEVDLMERVARDILVDDVQRILVNSTEAMEKMQDFVKDVAPQLQGRIFLNTANDIFSLYDVNGQLEKALRRRVWLKCGGYIIIDQMEALTSIDVNTANMWARPIFPTQS